MKNYKSEILNTKQYQNSNSQNRNLKALTPFPPLPLGEGAASLVLSRVRAFGIWSLVIIWLLVFGYWSFPAGAMGGKPAKQESKYKLEILKMEVVPLPAAPFPKKVLMVIAPRDFQDEEFSKPKELLEAKGVEVKVASLTRETAIGMYGTKVTPDISMKNAKATDYDAIVFVGGNGAAALADDPQALALAIEAKKHDKIIGAICIAPVILAKAGILEGKKATVSASGKNELINAGATYTGKGVEVDGKVVTGSGPASAEEFGQAILRVLEK